MIDEYVKDDGSVSASSPAGDLPQRWLSVSSVRGLAKTLKKRAVVIYGHSLHAVSRSAGYQNYDDALHNRHALQITLGEWKARLAAQFEMDEADLLSEEEWSKWYARLFVPRGRAAIEASAEPQPSEVVPNVEGEQDSEEIPAQVDHRQTAVDFLQARGGVRSGRASRS